MIYFIRTALFSAILCSLPLLANAQSWTFNANRATAPASIGGNRSIGFEIVCTQGEWILYPFGLPTAEGAPASINVDGQVFPVKIIYGNGSDGIMLNGTILKALKSGRRMQVSSSAPSSSFSATYTLRGSSRALEAVERNCGYPTSTTAPHQLKGPTGESDPMAERLAEQLLASKLEIMRREANKPDIDQQGAWFIDLDNGWRFLQVTVGYSNYHYGFSQFGTTVYAQPPGQFWQQILWLSSPVSVQIDTQQETGGWPNILLRNMRGDNQPLNLWSWNGQKYVHRQELPQ